MKASAISSCYLGPQISPEQFIPEHFFLYVGKGSITGYDGLSKYQLKAGECCLALKNRLARYSKHLDQGQFEKLVVIFDEAFLKKFQAAYAAAVEVAVPEQAFILLRPEPLLEHFIRSLQPYYNQTGKIDQDFADLKRTELLLILLRSQPELARLLFAFGSPEKADLESFMQRNYTFNVSLERFAYLTGRSLSAFKRDFEKIFHQTPSRWLVNKRLEAAHFLITERKQKPSEIYLELGFEDLSHFSHAFKKRFGYPPSKLPA